jgi:hypothetical protein
MTYSVQIGPRLFRKSRRAEHDQMIQAWTERAYREHPQLLRHMVPGQYGSRVDERHREL